MAEWITLDTHHGPVRAWQALPDGTARGGLVVQKSSAPIRTSAAWPSASRPKAMRCWRLRSSTCWTAPTPIRRPALRRRGREAGLERVGALGMERALEVVRAAATRLAPHGKVGTVGYCWGGTVALLSALRLGLPSVSYYGGRNVQFLDEAPKAPVIFHFGAQDRSIPPEAVQAHREKLPQMATYVYPADHAFNREVGHAYDPDSAALALQRTLDFFSEHLG